MSLIKALSQTATNANDSNGRTSEADEEIVWTEGDTKEGKNGDRGIILIYNTVACEVQFRGQLPKMPKMIWAYSSKGHQYYIDLSKCCEGVHRQQQEWKMKTVATVRVSMITRFDLCPKRLVSFPEENLKREITSASVI